VIEAALRAELASSVAAMTVETIPGGVRTHAKTLVLDLLGCLIAGARLPISRIAAATAAGSFPGRSASIWPSGERCTIAGAAFANAVSANAFDLDDGYRPVKGHPGACVVPAALAAAEATRASGGALLAAVVAGYEVALRAGRVLHAEYGETHCSGSWGALGAAAAVARVRGADADTLDRALAVAEYHAPLGPLMRDIDAPAMVKDGTGPGALAGALAYELASRGFGAPPHLLHDDARITLAAQRERAVLPRVGEAWLCLDVYFKPHACCRWAQPAVEAVLSMRDAFDAGEIAALDVATFAEATRLSISEPRSTEEAQYSVPWPLACAVLRGRVAPDEVSEPALRDKRLLALARLVRLHVDAELDARFPARACARVEVVLRDGRRIESGVVEARGEPHTRLARDDLRSKFDELAAPVLGSRRAAAVASLVELLDELECLDPLWDALRGGGGIVTA
jgi:2-methylcitrate dehydratase PrpD